MNREVHVRFWESAGLKCPAPLAYLKGYADGHEAKAGISDWIIFYNERRLHQALGYRAPIAVWREGAAPNPNGHVDNANALTTCPQGDHKQQTQPLAA
ncbi:MAG TPA: integrase core domain-containing protein [Bryobacteraceae bacterium]|nr:integrase core domain-containing protein [Bryobacteraceae bacterium]